MRKTRPIYPWRSLVAFLLVMMSCFSPRKSEKARRLFHELPADGITVAYRGKNMPRADYNREKDQELREFEDELRQKYPMRFNFKVSKYFLLACDCDARTQAGLQEYLDAFFQTIYPRYFKYEPPGAWRIVYFKNKADFHEQTGSEAYGFYVRNARIMNTYVGSGHGTLWHELTHGFVDANVSRSTAVTPAWFDEGFASFYEMAFLERGGVSEGYTNWRLPMLQASLRAGKVLPLKTALKYTGFTENFNYAEARFFFVYLWVNGKMEDFVRAYIYEILPKSIGAARDEDTVKLVERLLGKDIETIDKEYRAMALKLAANVKLTQIAGVR